eukprot:COSAG02_NODE_294_length_25426_cov_719.561298_3_plen_70_part_01
MSGAWPAITGRCFRRRPQPDVGLSLCLPEECTACQNTLVPIPVLGTGRYLPQNGVLRVRNGCLVCLDGMY